MKSKIEWHENCLKNRKQNLDRKRETLNRLEREIAKECTSYNFYLAQINLAKKEKKDGFDEDLYAIKRLCV